MFTRLDVLQASAKAEPPYFQLCGMWNNLASDAQEFVQKTWLFRVEELSSLHILHAVQLTTVTHLSFSEVQSFLPFKMRAIDLFLVATAATAQSISYVYTATFTETAFAYVSFTTCPCPPSSTGFSSSPTMMSGPSSSMTTTTSYSGPLLLSDTIVPASSISMFTTTPAVSSGMVPASSTTSASGLPVVTNDAYINAVLRHHNVHRSNHSADPLIWNPIMATYAREIAETCVYGHVT